MLPSLTVCACLAVQRLQLFLIGCQLSFGEKVKRAPYLMKVTKDRAKLTMLYETVVSSSFFPVIYHYQISILIKSTARLLVSVNQQLSLTSVSSMMMSSLSR